MRTFWFREETYTILRPKPQQQDDDDSSLWGCLFLIVLFIIICFAIKGCTG